MYVIKEPRLHSCKALSSCHTVNTQLCIVYVHYIRLHESLSPVCVSAVLLSGYVWLSLSDFFY